jgi:xylose isomerase
MAGAATSPFLDAYCHGAAQVKKAIEVTHELGGAGYTFWGGREGYETLLNTDMKAELDHLARFLHMAVAYKKEIGFEGQFYIEPKPKEPTTHQYDHDAAACYAFLQHYGLVDHLKLNIEANHATLAGHKFLHELRYAAQNGILGSVDANRGDLLLGWDTDQFATDLYDTTMAMLTLLECGGFTTGGFNFDAKLRRQSVDPIDLFHAHIGAMDTFARGLKCAAKIREDGRLADFLNERYSSWDSDLGRKIEAGEADFHELEKVAMKNNLEHVPSGRQEMLENLINDLVS